MAKLCAAVCVYGLSGALLHRNSLSCLSAQIKKLPGIFADLSSILLFGQVVSSSGIINHVFLF